MKQLLLILLTGCLSIVGLIAQNNGEKSVKKALERYIDAGDKNDAGKLDKCLHTDFRVALYDGKEDKIKILDRATYLSFIKDKKFGGYERTSNYQSVEFIGEHMANVSIVLTSPGKPTLKNFYALVKEQRNWTVLQDYVTLIP